MAVKLRLMRMGKKKQPTYRVVAADSRSPRDGRFIEIIGVYEPRAEPSVVRIDQEKANKWLSQGAQPTEVVAKLLKIAAAGAGWFFATSISLRTRSVGWAPLAIHSSAFAVSIDTTDGSERGS